MIQLTHQHIHDWTYFTEGNAHVVLNYTGNDTKLTGYALRLSKSNADQQVPNGFHTDFRHHIITTLLGSDYIDQMVPVQATPEFINAIRDKIYNDRPLDRRTSTIHHSASVFLTKNWTLFYAPKDTWTFEIKPKWGFLPNSMFVDKKHRRLKKTMCRFCMHRRLRQHEQGQTHESHHYCPLDLYSGDPQRIRKALMISLTRPHNYLKVFYNGQLVPPTEWVSSVPLLFDPPLLGDNDWVEQVADVLVDILMQDPILRTLKRLQQALDEYDVEGIYPLYQKHGQQPTHDIDHWKYIVQQFVERQSLQNCDDIGDDKANGTRCEEKEELQRLYEYLLSMTLKDCSVMICMAKDQGDTTLPRTQASGSAKAHSSGGHCFQYQIKVVDVDMKKWSKIPFWFDLDRRIIQHNLQQRYGRICLD